MHAHIDTTMRECAYMNAYPRTHKHTHAHPLVHTDQHDRYVLVNPPRALSYTHAVQTRAHARWYFHTGTHCSRPIDTRAPARTSACAHTVRVHQIFAVYPKFGNEYKGFNYPVLMHVIASGRPHGLSCSHTYARMHSTAHAQKQTRRYARYAAVHAAR
jgi:hypothetical protein